METVSGVNRPQAFPLSHADRDLMSRGLRERGGGVRGGRGVGVPGRGCFESQGKKGGKVVVKKCSFCRITSGHFLLRTPQGPSSSAGTESQPRSLAPVPRCPLQPPPPPPPSGPCSLPTPAALASCLFPSNVKFIPTTFAVISAWSVLRCAHNAGSRSPSRFSSAKSPLWGSCPFGQIPLTLSFGDFLFCESPLCFRVYRL